jgi:hypothetical protein
MTESHVTKEITNPAFLTQSEYIRAMNPDEKIHPNSAYDMTLEKINSFYNPDKYKLVKRFKLAGLDFELLVNQEKNNYAMRNPDKDSFDPWLRIDGQIVYYTDEQINDFGYEAYSYSFSITHDGKRVALADNEWGAWLFVVAREYRGLGLGVIIGKMARTYHPFRSSGGFTSSGLQNIRKIHTEFVRDALSSGLYSKAVKEQAISIDRVKEIVSSVGKRSKRELPNLSSSDPKSWLLYADDSGTFVLYDKKLKDLMNDRHHFSETMIKGAIYVAISGNYGRIKMFGADTPKLRTFMLSLGLMWSKQHNAILVVDSSEYDVEGFEFGEETFAAGYPSREVLGGPMGDSVVITGLAKQEQNFRSFDRYEEFKYFMHELADSKYR